MNSTDKQSPFLTPKETADYLRVAVSTIYDWRRLGKLPGRKHGGKLLFDRHVVETFGKADTPVGCSFHDGLRIGIEVFPERSQRSLTKEESVSRSHRCRKEAENGL